VDVDAAARRWAEVWSRAWPEKDVEAIAVLYAGDATYLPYPFREPDEGIGEVRSYLTRTFGEETNIECWFGEPLAGRDRATVEWWACWAEAGDEITMTGTTVLRFNEAGLVVDHRDYWNQTAGRRPPYAAW
jgi:hypothetical protein